MTFSAGAKHRIPVPADLQKGAETAQWVLDQITTFPETHDQHSWKGDSPVCGTTYCVAGWAATVHGDLFLDRFTHWGYHMEVDWPEAGQVALGLDDFVAAEWLFSSHRTREQVLLGLKALANGERLDWEAIEDASAA